MRNWILPQRVKSFEWLKMQKGYEVHFYGLIFTKTTKGLQYCLGDSVVCIGTDRYVLGQCVVCLGTVCVPCF